MRYTTKLIIPILALLIAVGCKDPYGPPENAVNTGYLVVEGYLNGNGPTSIALSRTFNLDDSARVRPELLAQVTVQGKNGGSFSLAASGGGVYRINQLPLQENNEYRVLIRTVEGKEYYSDYVEYKRTPAIDSISWRRVDDGLQLYANTHDEQNKTIYYRWDYDETWEFHSPYFSYFDYVNGRIVDRDRSTNISVCWASNTSTNILLGSSAKLQEDVISMSPLTLIPSHSWKLSVKYSMLLRQYALTEKAYQYWQNMMKNSEKIGSIFDPQPTEIKGNIYAATDPEEVVIGYISAGTIEEKRIFIKGSDVPNWRYRHGCLEDVVADRPDTLAIVFGNGVYEPIDLASTPSGGPAYSYSTADCIDCRLKGVNVRPPFWQ